MYAGNPRMETQKRKSVSWLLTLPFTVFHPQPSPAKLRDDGTKCVPTFGPTQGESWNESWISKLQTNKSPKKKHPNISPLLKKSRFTWMERFFKKKQKMSEIHCFKGHHFHFSYSLGSFLAGMPRHQPWGNPMLPGWFLSWQGSLDETVDSWDLVGVSWFP